jgi:hypothetical protein
VTRTATYVVELLVGLACVGLAAITWRQPGLTRVAAVGFAIAGLAATAHAVYQLFQ